MVLYVGRLQARRERVPHAVQDLRGRRDPVRPLPLREELRDGRHVALVSRSGQLREGSSVTLGATLGHVVEEPESDQVRVQRDGAIRADVLKALALLALARARGDADAGDSVHIDYVRDLKLRDLLGATPGEQHDQ